jgi:peptidoglycan/xylan/chitin deacetylase (PgdA/CDA1 family)
MPFKRIPILLYHRIARTRPDDDPMGLAVSPELFEAQMRSLKKQGIQTVRPSDIMPEKRHSGALPGKSLVITFDDGFLDNYINAFPILMRYNLTATIFVVPDCIGKRSYWTPMDSYPLMDWAHIREMAKYGFDIQNHSSTHADLTALDDREAERQITESRETIEDLIGSPVSLLSYPFGKFNASIMHITERAGYRYAYAAGMSCNADYCIERLPIFERDGITRFTLKSGGWGSWIRHMNNLSRSCSGSI